MTEDKKMPKKTHNVIMENRHMLSISGVQDVDSFDDQEILLFTELGGLEVKGDNLHINRLSIESGEISIEGDLYSLTYSDNEVGGKQGFFSKLFK